MTGIVSSVGVDFTLPDAPPLLDAPLSLLDYARMLVDNAGQVAAASEANERAISAQAAVSAALDRMGDAATPEAKQAAADEVERLGTLSDELTALSSEAQKRAADIERWTLGFQYLPELPLGATEVWAPGTVVTETGLNPDQTGTKATGNNQTAFAWYNPFEAVSRDDRSLFGWPNADFADRARRAMRSLQAHEAYQVEHEFWSGDKIPTNYHLTASAQTPTTSPLRVITAWADPAAAPGTVLGTAVGLRKSLAALDQAIASGDGGTGIIHATPYLVQLWMSMFPFIRDTDGKIYTVNHNLILAGYGYPGTGPDRAARAVTDGTTASTTAATSATAAFTGLDVGAPISGTDLQAGTVIAAVTNGTTIVLSKASTGNTSGGHWTIGGTGGDNSGGALQWAYATEMVYQLRGDARTYPWDLRQMSPAATVANEAPVRAERSWACITNHLVRSAVLVDTTVVT